MKSKVSQINPVEQHLEKAVLALCAGFFVVALVIWGLSSPRGMELTTAQGREKVPPDGLDAILSERANRLVNEVRNVSPEPVQIPDYLADITLLQTKPMDKIGPPVILTPPSQPRETRSLDVTRTDAASLEQLIPPPPKPIVRADRELPYTLTRSEELTTARIVSVYPWNQLVEQWKTPLRNARVPSTPVVVAVEAQVQQLRPDGTWGEPRLEKGLNIDIDADESPLTIPEIPAYTGDNADAITELVKVLKTDEWQVSILQPEYWKIWWPGGDWVEWRVNLPQTEVSQAAKAESEQPVEATPLAALAARPSPASRRRVEQSSGEVSSQIPVEDPEFYMAAMRSMSRDMGDTRQPPRTSRIPERSGPSVAVPEAPPPPEPTYIPNLAWQKNFGKVLVWMHDISPRPGMTYRYRLRLKLLNPLLTYKNSAKTPQDASLSYLLSPFSEWTDPVSIPEVTEFFVVGGTESSGSVYVDVFTRALGQQVKESFAVLPGQPIGTLRQIDLTNPATGKTEKVGVDFTTRSIAVDFDFNKQLPGERTTTEVLYLTPANHMSTMIDVRDMNRSSLIYKRFRELEANTSLSRKAAAAAAATTVGR